MCLINKKMKEKNNNKEGIFLNWTSVRDSETDREGQIKQSSYLLKTIVLMLCVFVEL